GRQLAEARQRGDAAARVGEEVLVAQVQRALAELGHVALRLGRVRVPDLEAALQPRAAQRADEALAPDVRRRQQVGAALAAVARLGRRQDLRGADLQARGDVDAV